jgi:hypothetical protein
MFQGLIRSLKDIPLGAIEPGIPNEILVAGALKTGTLPDTVVPPRSEGLFKRLPKGRPSNAFMPVMTFVPNPVGNEPNVPKLKEPAPPTLGPIIEG